jgi:Mg-chelatase subunit ChlD
VLLELTGTSSASEHSGLDLVAVLDVSGSMEGPKLHKLKTAMNFVTSKLGPMDRFSIAPSPHMPTNKRCGSCLMTAATKEKLKGIIETISARGKTNMREGLDMGLRVLNDRRHMDKTGRASGVVLMH